MLEAGIVLFMYYCRESRIRKVRPHPATCEVIDQSLLPHPSGGYQGTRNLASKTTNVRACSFLVVLRRQTHLLDYFRSIDHHSKTSYTE